ncbi:MAG: carboxymuconolactone decarboxylase family protein [Rhodospirillales bacterium]|jgi:AhpD family alkylhydroperoxidase|nr:carboxymuconolactone decarboxylase family protein [Rhodospirillales bacterium]
MTLRLKERGMVAIGASVSSGCKPCTDYHVKAARTVALTNDELRQTIDDAMSVRQNALNVMKAHGLSHLGETDEADGGRNDEPTTRIRELVSIAAAFAVNCTTNLDKHLGSAEALGISDKDIRDVIKLAAFIKDEAASRVENMVAPEGIGEQGAYGAPLPKAGAMGSCGCAIG